MKTRAHKEVEHILGREVKQALIPYDTSDLHSKFNKECADCKQPAKYLVVEKRQPNDHDYFRAWYYCGVCEVG